MEFDLELLADPEPTAESCLEDPESVLSRERVRKSRPLDIEFEVELERMLEEEVERPRWLYRALEENPEFRKFVATLLFAL